MDSVKQSQEDSTKSMKPSPSTCWVTPYDTALVIGATGAAAVQALAIAYFRHAPLSLPYHGLALAFLALAFGGTRAGNKYLARTIAAIAAMPPVPASETGTDRDRAITLALMVNVGMLSAYAFSSLAMIFVAFNVPPMNVLYAIPYAILTVFVVSTYIFHQNRINILDAEDDSATEEMLAAQADRAATNDAAIVADVRRMIAEKCTDDAIAVAVRTKYFVLERVHGGLSG